MKVSQLFAIYPEIHFGENINDDVSGITRDSREVEKGFVFVAVPGHQQDGHDYLDSAVENGASALVVSDPSRIPESFAGSWVKVESPRVALHRLASRYYGEPANELFCVGVTGTNGKTTITYMVEQVLKTHGWKTGVLGTINHHLEDHVWNSSLTTPDAIELQKRLREFRALGAQAAVFEVSSHALSQYRVDELPFDVAVFSNLTRDHLDYHLTMESYFKSKERLFSEVLAHSEKPDVYAVVNTSDDYGKKINVTDRARVFSYGERNAHLTFKVISQDFRGSLLQVKTPQGESRLHLPLPGRFNISNALAAMAVGLSAGISQSRIVEALEGFQGVPGRLQRVGGDGQPIVFVDYAHTPDALQKVLEELNEIRRASQLENRIITVFGCGGDRDKGKRPLMGKVAFDLSDYAFITSDNPRTEDPDQIIREIRDGMPEQGLSEKIFADPDRESAIGRALQMAHQDDVILIAGKGHETYQIIGNETLDFDDREVVIRLLNGED